MCRYCIDAFGEAFGKEANCDKDMFLFDDDSMEYDGAELWVGQTIDCDADTNDFKLHLTVMLTTDGRLKRFDYFKKINYCPVCGQKLTIDEVD